MTDRQPRTVTLADGIRLLRAYPLRWVLPALAVALVAASYALFTPRQWEATQGLMIRNDALGTRDAAGQFEHDNEMKVTQETLLEIAKSRAVLAGALRRVGPLQDAAAPDWPSVAAIERLRDTLRLAAPTGAEFGQTEVFYLKVRDEDRRRAVALAEAIYEELDGRFRDLRGEKVQGVLRELTKAVQLGRSKLDESTGRLGALEKQVGTDLAELRILNTSPSDTSDLRRQAVDLESELRRARTERHETQELLSLLDAARSDPSRLLSAPNDLLQSQPALRQLKEGLTGARLRTAELLGQMTAEHPSVKAARVAEEEIRRQIEGELDTAVHSLRSDLRLLDGRIELLAAQRAKVTHRLQRLATLRADYANLVAEVEQDTAVLAEARHKLADARARLTGAHVGSLISRIDAAAADTDPAGPGRATILALGLLGGLATGGGVLLVTVPAGANLAGSCEACAGAEAQEVGGPQPVSGRAETPARPAAASARVGEPAKNRNGRAAGVVERLLRPVSFQKAYRRAAGGNGSL